MGIPSILKSEAISSLTDETGEGVSAIYDLSIDQRYGSVGIWVQGLG